MRLVLRKGDSGIKEMRRSLWQRNCCSTKSISTEEGVVDGTNVCATVVGAEDHVLCAVKAEGGTTACSSAKLLSTIFLIGSESTKVEGFGFPLLPLSKTAHLGSFAHAVPTVPDGPTTSEMEGPGAVGTDGVCQVGEHCFLVGSQGREVRAHFLVTFLECSFV